MGESAINPCEIWIKQNPAISFAGLCLVKWCLGGIWIKYIPYWNTM